MAEAKRPQPTWIEQRALRLVARGIFDRDQWVAYRDRVTAQFSGHPADRLAGSSRPEIIDDTQDCIWFFPAEPNLTTLQRAADPLGMRRILRNRKGEILDYPGRITEVRVPVSASAATGLDPCTPGRTGPVSRALSAPAEPGAPGRREPLG